MDRITRRPRVFHIDREGSIEDVLKAPKHHRERGSAEMEHFFHDVAKAVSDAQEILVCGPGSAKLELIRHVHRHDKPLEARIVGIESADHPTDGQLAKYVRAYFREKDRMTGGGRPLIQAFPSITFAAARNASAAAGSPQ
jgi:hypothetical protein